MARLQIGFVQSHRLQIIRLLAHCRWDVVARLRHGRITHVLGEDVQATGLAAFLMLQCAVAAALLAGQWVLVFLLSPTLALLVSVLLAAAALALRPVLRRSAELGKGLVETNLGLVTGTVQFLGGLKLALSQNLQRGFVEEFEEGSAKAASRRIAFTRQRTGTQLTLTALASFVAGLVIFIGVGVIDAAPASLVAFLFILARMNGPAALIQSSAQQVFHSLPAYAKIKEIEAELALAQEEQSPETVLRTKTLSGRVELRGVGFRHEEREEEGAPMAGVAGIDLVIEAGSFVGITGPSGAGKTTLADLLIGLYPPREGAILVDGIPLQGATLSPWRQAMSYVSQDPFLFHDTIRRNLLWARPEASEEEIWQALALAGADGLVRRLDGQLEAIAGERGTLLSGGERQRIALARALIRKPVLLLLDEATNAIDVDGEREILRRLSDLPSRPTILMIAHREASLALCDRIVELRDGRIVRHDPERRTGTET
jgi:ATP-binding cassette subfamily C protein